MTPMLPPRLRAVSHALPALRDPAFQHRSPLGRLLAMLRQAWQAVTLDDRSRYLSRATDLADLERRTRIWDRAD
jgi:hypothetical protein